MTRESRISAHGQELTIFYEIPEGFYHGHNRSWIDLKVGGKIGRKFLDNLETSGLLEEAKDVNKL